MVLNGIRELIKNRRYHTKQFAKFASVNIFGMFTGLAIIGLLVELGHVHYLIASVIATMVSAMQNYTVHVLIGVAKNGKEKYTS